MKRVLLVISTPLKNAGVPNVIMNIVNKLHKKFIFDVLVCGFEKGYYDDKFESFGGKIYRVNFLQKNYKRFSYIKKWINIYKTAKKLLRDNKYDIIHCNNGFESSAVLMASSKRKNPIRIVHSHGTFSVNSGSFVGRHYKKLCQKIIIKRSTNMLACSDISGNSLFCGGKFKNVLNPIDVTQFKFEKKKHTEINLLQIGYFCRLKNQLFSFKVLEKLLNMGVDTYLYLIGFVYEDSYFELLNKYIEEKNLSDRIKFLDSDFPKCNIMNKTDFLLLPSKSEGLPLVALEGQAADIYCVFSDRVTREVDVGLASFLSIDEPEKWAKLIFSKISYEQKADKEKLLQFDLENYVKTINLVYSGK